VKQDGTLAKNVKNRYPSLSSAILGNTACLMLQGVQFHSVKEYLKST
jgi:hypothetical protein